MLLTLSLPHLARAGNDGYSPRQWPLLALPIDSAPTIAPATPRKKVDKRGQFSFTSAWQSLDPYLGSYDTSKLQYLSLEVKYQFWFGLFASIAPEFLFNKDSIQFSGNYFTVGVMREWFDNFNAGIYYSYNVHQDGNNVRRLKTLYRNDMDIDVSYDNDYIVPELKYDFTFGTVNGGRRTLSGYDNVSVFGMDHVINLGISHNFVIFDSTRHGDLSIKLGNNYNFGTANALLSSRQYVANPNYDPKKPVSLKNRKYILLDFPITGDKFSALNTEFSVSLDYTWRFMEITPIVNVSIPFRDLGKAQSQAEEVTVKGVSVAPPASIISKVVVWGGVSLAFNFPFRKVK